MPGPWLALKARRKPRIESKPLSIGSLGLDEPPEPRAEVVDLLGLSLIPLLKGARECTRLV
jgi:hypothetical protein